MAMDEYIGWICLAGIVSSLITWSVSFSHISKFKKSNFRNLWEKDIKKETFWRSHERQLADELLFKKPYWLEGDKNANVWLWVYRGSVIIFLLSGLITY